MTTKNLFDDGRDALHELIQLIQHRVETQAAYSQAFTEATGNASREINRTRIAIAGQREAELTALRTAWDDAKKSIAAKLEQEHEKVDSHCKTKIQETEDESAAAEEKTRATYADALWTADSMHEAAEKQSDEQFTILQRKAASGADAIAKVRHEAVMLMSRANLSFAGPDPMTGQPDGNPAADALLGLQKANSESNALLDELRQGSKLRFDLLVILLLVVSTIAFGAIPLVVASGDSKMTFVIVGASLGLLIGGIASYFLMLMARRRRMQVAGIALQNSLQNAEYQRVLLVSRAQAEHESRLAEAAQHRAAARQRADDKYPAILQQIEQRRINEIHNHHDRHESHLEKLRQWNYDKTLAIEGVYAPAIKACEEKHDRALAEAEATYQRKITQATAERDRARSDLSTQWVEGVANMLSTTSRLKTAAGIHFQPWDKLTPLNEETLKRIPRGILYGKFLVDFPTLMGDLTDSPDFPRPRPASFQLPAFLPFPDKCSLILRTRDLGKRRAVVALQDVMLRFLTSLPPGKVRFTILDPVGLGENFAAFMHLADYDEAMINSRIWTEPNQIEQRLADITAHMENVIQKYLRNQYRTIEEYNEQAGEVAEPYRVLVVANFPVNFTPDAAKRLVSIVQSGPACGVYTLVSVDTKAPLPQGFDLADLEQSSVTLSWRDTGFAPKDADLAKFPLELEEPPAGDRVVELVRSVGERGRDANRVQVPFDFVATKPQDIWRGDASRGISVPIGRAGATKRQLFELGKGTAQHALIAGKTGSGKSTLLHVLITNLASTYSPDEVELYLIDFKKGVEFKAYAAHKLPHARVVAVESEREFGLSVLHRLDQELQSRGDRFRAEGVNDLAGYREVLRRQGDGNGARCPRIMLVVDEFQEFFVEDDRLSQEAALLLDRLVRQGRAFGVHILLGSQTLAGAYSLARSTIDQMAVRIALQCSDADAQLILSKENSAARLLSRPGEGIYNNANGLIEGNDLFQVVWLSEEERERRLNAIQARAEQNGKSYPASLVFEGNTVADINSNRSLRELLERPERPSGARATTAWLGEAIAIKDPTAATFRPTSGSNLLVVGQHDEAAVALMAISLAALTLQHSTGEAKFFLLDGTPDDDVHSGKLERVTGYLGGEVQLVERHRLGEVLAEIAAEVTARQKGESADRHARYVFVHGLHRYRDLRKEDEFGFGRRDRTISPAENFATIYRDGPAVGIHVMLWCDSIGNLTRAIDRPGLREFGMRVLFQMSANDSSVLIDTPAASKLGRHRALFLTEEQPQPEKFRPYGFPASEWLQGVAGRFANNEAVPRPALVQ